jgi:molecular chaperone GrpE
MRRIKETKKGKTVEDQDRPPIELETDRADDSSPGGRVYDIAPDSTGPVEAAPEAEEAAGTDVASPLEETAEAGEAAEAGGEPAEQPVSGRRPLKISRKDLLDRFAEKNSAITRLTREKSALEKAFAEERAALAGEKDALEAQVKDLKDKWLRTAAEFENYRKRTAKEWELLKQQSRTEVILEVLNSLDDFERAFAVVEENESEFVRGIRLIYNNLLLVLQKLGVVELDALHQPFDPVRHMAIGQIETNEVASGHVVQVVKKGYVLNGSVIRPAHVIVAK